jgi:uncharacterized membrane protein
MTSKFLNHGLVLPGLTVIGLAITSPAMAVSLYSVSPLKQELSFLDAINNSGQVIPDGKTFNNKGQRVSGSVLINSDGTTQDLGRLNPEYPEGTSAYAINNLGQVVGYSGGVAFVWTKEKGISSIPNTDFFGDASDINDQGIVVGTYGTASRGTDGFIYNLTTGITQLIPEVGEYYNIAAAGINSKNDVVGGYYDGIARAILYSNNTIQTLNNLIPANSGWFLEYATDINDNGQIIGFGTLNGERSNFLLTPINNPPTSVPEPSAGVGTLFVAALVTAGILKRKQVITH